MSYTQEAKKLPIIYSLIGIFLRRTPPFRGKTRIQTWLAKRLRGKNFFTVVNLPGGEVIRLYLDDWIPFRVFITGAYDFEALVETHMLQQIKKGMQILDIGANIGYYTIQFSSRVGNMGQVHAFEPIEYNHKLLSQNVELNSLTNVVCNRLALSSKAGQQKIFFNASDNTGMSSFAQLSSQATAEVVTVTTVDQYLQSRAITAVDLIKIDVEGAELLVLQGAEQTLSQQNGPLLYIEINSYTLAEQNVTPIAIIEFLETFDYVSCKITPDGVIPERNFVDEPLVFFVKKDRLREFSYNG